MGPIDASARRALAITSPPAETSRKGPLRVAVLGFGTVGQALAQLLAAQPGLGKSVTIVAAADRRGVASFASGADPSALLDAKRTRGAVGFEKAPASLAEWVAGLACDVVVDVLPSNLDTGDPSRSIALAALESGKHVVTANKGLLALHGPELDAAARAAGLQLRSGAAVAGGIPILELLSGAFRGDRALRFEAILNGSSNFVLTQLERGASWDEALREARSRGILEADPSLDLSGRDAAAKAVILANALWRGCLRLPDVRVAGIWGIDAREVKDAADRGLAVRLVVRADPESGIRVAPVTLPREHPLVMEGTENAIRLTLRGAGTIMLRGPGAGGTESASKVLSDLLGLCHLS